jgi:hypothetical protein
MQNGFDVHWSFIARKPYAVYRIKLSDICKPYHQAAPRRQISENMCDVILSFLEPEFNDK